MPQKTKIQISSKQNNNYIIYQGEHSNLKDAIETAVKHNISLRNAYLSRYLINKNKAKHQIGTLQNLNVPNANFEFSCFEGQNLTNANFSGAKLINTSFERAILKNVSFKGADITNISFNFADIDGIKIEGAIHNNNIVKSLHNIPFYVSSFQSISIQLLICDNASFILQRGISLDLNNYLDRINKTDAKLYYDIINHIYSLKIVLKTKLSKKHKQNYREYKIVNNLKKTIQQPQNLQSEKKGKISKKRIITKISVLKQKIKQKTR